jgi:hypothetical protein
MAMSASDFAPFFLTYLLCHQKTGVRTDMRMTAAVAVRPRANDWTHRNIKKLEEQNEESLPDKSGKLRIRKLRTRGTGQRNEVLKHEVAALRDRPERVPVVDP